jgi:trk system potassium uptake protein TrkA
MFKQAKNFVQKILPHQPQEKATAPRPGKNEFVILGLGRFGSSLSTALHEAGYEVLGIDSDTDIVQQRSLHLPHVVSMDVTNRDALIEMGISSFDTAVVCIGSDFESNVLATVLLRELGVRRVICKARTRTQRSILLKVGADEVILPEQEAGQRLARRLISTGIVDFMDINEDMSVVEMETPGYLVGQSLMESDLRKVYNVVVVAIRREGRVVILPIASEVLRKNDILVVIGETEDCQKLSRLA